MSALGPADELTALLAGAADAPGVGVDVEEIARWEEPDVRLFTAAEREHCARGQSAERYAGRWCAKEAVVKALAPYVAASLRDVEILAGPAGEPLVRLADRVASPDVEVRVSIAHSRTLAVAVAVAGPPSAVSTRPPAA